MNSVSYHTVKVDGLNIFYREAGPRNAPTLLLLHGFPTSSQMFRNLIPLLADSYHLVASEQNRKGQIKVGQYADLAVLSADYCSVPEDDIEDIESVLTLLGGKVVHGAADFADLAPPLAPTMPDWSPVRAFGGYQRSDAAQRHQQYASLCACAQGCGVHGHAHGRAFTETGRPERAKGVLGGAGLLLLGVLIDTG